MTRAWVGRRKVQGCPYYSAAGKPFTVKLERLAGDKLRAAWFDPREGIHHLLNEVARRGTREFTPPTQGEGQDWILVLNDASRNFQLPQ